MRDDSLMDNPNDWLMRDALTTFSPALHLHAETGETADDRR
jgi:hypothetical protein